MNSVKKVLLLVCTTSLITGCGENTQPEEKKEETVNKYTVTWKDEDGTVLEVDNDVTDNQLPIFNGELPTKAGDAQYTYSFKDWSPKVTTISQDTIYTATYTVVTNEYNVIWKDEDGTILEIDKVPYGIMPTFDGSKPKKENTPEFSYEFVGFSPKVSAVTGDVVYFASYKETKNTYSVTWKNIDGTVLEVDDKVPYGEMPTYDGINPSKAGDAQYSYNWTGWSPAVEPVSEDVTYVATFAASVNDYKVTWKNYDGTTLNVDTVHYGTVPTYDGKDPKKESNVQYTYSWTGWDKEVSAVTSDVTYTATFSETINKYKVTWENYDGTVLETDDAVEYGTLPTYDGTEPVRLANEQYSYKWTGWSPIVSEVTGDIKYTATFEEDLNTYTVTWKNHNGEVLEVDEKVPFGTLPTFDGTTPTKATDSKYTYEWAGWDAEIKEVTGDVTYTAVFNSTQYGYTVNFDLKGGSSTSYIESKIVTEITSDVFFYDVTKENVNFRGWLYNNQLIFDEHGNKVNYVELVDNMTFAASYSNTAKLTLISNIEGAGTLTGGGECDFYTYTNVSASTNQGYNFIGWYQIDKSTLKPDLLIATEPEYKFLMFTEDTTIMAVFEYGDFDLHIYSNNVDLGRVFDTSSKAQQPFEDCTFAHAYLSSVTVSAITITDTYRFLGWYDEDNNLVSPNAVYTFTMVNYNYTLEAKWDRFTITYDLDGGENRPENPGVFSKDDVKTLLAPSKNYYSFTGWEYNGQIIESVDGSIQKHITLVAKWKPIDYAITYNLNGGVNNKDNPETYNIEQEVEFLDASKDYYDFDKWTDTNGNEITGIETGNHAPITINANWTPTIYSISYDLNGGVISEENPGSYNIESNPIILKNPTRDYYDFDSWVDSNGNEISVIETGTHGNLSLKATWIPNEYGITYNLNGGVNNKDNPETYNIEEKVEFLDASKDYYDFVKWTDTNGNEITGIDAGNHTPVTVNANWTPTIYSIEYKLNGGINSELNPSSYSIESETLTLNQPTKNGDLFDGWYLEPDFKTEVTEIATGSHGNITLYAKWCGLENFNYSIDGQDINLYTVKDKTLVTKVDFDLRHYQIVEISTNIFSGCSSLTSVVIPNSVTSIGSYAFDDCSSLTSVVIPNSVTSIGYGAFCSCTALISLFIPNSVTTIGSYAFEKCSSLTIYCETTSRPSGWDSYWNYYRPVAWGCIDHITKDGINFGITSDGNLVVASLADKTITELVIPSNVDGRNVVGIAEYAFYNCSSLTSIVIPNSVTSIGFGVVYGCSSLEFIALPFIGASVDSPAYFGYLFGSNDSWNYGNIPATIKTVIIEDGCKAIIGNAFNKLSSLTSVVIPNSVTTIGSHAFYNCSSLTIYCEASSRPAGWDSYWTESNYRVIWGCSGITTKDGINYAITNDGDYIVASLADKTITDLIIPSNVDGRNVVGIVTDAFRGCSSLTSVVIPNSVTTIGSHAFYNCSSLTSVVIPNSVTSIGSYAFYYCSSLTSIVIPNSVISIDVDAFRGCSSLTIYCETTSRPSGWKSDWNYNNRPVVWGCTDHITKDGINFGIISDENLVVASLADKTITDLIIPSNVDGRNVVGIVTDAFRGCSSLTSVVIPNSVTSIGSYAFYNCSSLTSVVIPNSVTSIGSYAFYYCSSLTSVVIPNSVTTIGSAAFYNCSSLTSIVIPNSVASIDAYAFQECSSLTIYCEATSEPIGWTWSWNYYRPVAWGCIDHITKDGINFGITSDGNLVVASLADKTITELVIPSNVDGRNVVGIAEYAFYKCSSLTSIVIPNSVTSIDYYTFCGCSSLTIYCETESKPSGWNSSWNYYRPVAWGCIDHITKDGINFGIISDGNLVVASLADKTITELVIPSNVDGRNVVGIAEYAFYNCSSLTSIVIPDSVITIGSYAFYNCSSLTSVVIPNSVTSIGSYAFKECSSLTIYCEAESKPSGWDSYWNYYRPVAWGCIDHITKDGINFGIISDGNLVVASLADKTITELVIPSNVDGRNVVGIAEYAFYNCSSLTSIVIPDSVITIGSYAFEECSSLTSIVIPNSVTSIGSDAFKECSSLTIYCEAESKPSGWNSSWNYNDRPVAWGCVDHITIDGVNYGITPDGNFVVASIIDQTITELVIPSNVDGRNVVGIAEYAFYNCSSLTSIVIPDSVITIGSYAFYNCSSLTSVVIPNSVTTIGSHAFYNCSSLTSVVVSNSVTSLGSYAFYKCSSLTSIVIPDSVITIGSYAFYNCSSLTSVVIPNSVTTIGLYAFYNCSSLTSIVIPNSVISIDVYAFRGCSSLTIYCEATSRPSGWDSYWNYYRPVAWGCVDHITIDGVNYGITPDGNFVVASIIDQTITELVIPSNVDGRNVVGIAEYAFYNCSSLTSVVVSNSVTSLGSYAFYNCSSLTSIVIPDSVITIGSYAFYNCSSLTSVVIPNSVTTIGSYAFGGCSSLTSVVIPNSVTTIGSYAFYRCSSLTIYCEATSRPSGWGSSWNYYRPVVWGYVVED